MSLYDNSRDEIKTQVKGDLKSFTLCLKTNNSNNKKKIQWMLRIKLDHDFLNQRALVD